MSINTDLIEGIKLSAEEAFIINCLRSEFCDDNKLGKIDLSTIDWNTVYKISIQWAVTVLLYKIINKQSHLPGFSSIPQEFLQKIKIAYLRTFLANERNFKKLAELLEVFNRAGIKVILLKGSHLAQFVYKDIGLRPMGDIDIMIKEFDLHKAVELLCQMGYDYLQMPRDSGKRLYLTEKDIKSHHHIPGLGCREGIRNLEVHWTIIRPFLPVRIDIEGLWTRANQVKINNASVLVLSPEDMIMHISMHASYDKRFTSDIKSYCDIATIITRYTHEIDWAQLKVRAVEWGVEKSVYLTMRLSQDILGLSLPDNILRSLKPGSPHEKIVLEAQNRIFSPTNIKKPNDTYIIHPEMFRSNVALNEKISYLLNKIFIPPEKLAALYSLPISSKRAYLYYIVRLFSLILNKSPRYIKFAFYLLTHKKAYFHSFNLDTWLTPSNSGKSNAISQALPLNQPIEE
jgi:transposase